MKDSPPTVLITGASRGIGFEFARQYAADKWNVIACCRAPGKAEELQALATAKPTVHIEKLDVTDDENIAALAEKLKDTVLDLLINGAGIFSGAGPHVNALSNDKTQSFGSIDSNAWMQVLRTDAVAPIMVSEAFQKNLSLSAKGKLVMISSRMGSIASISRPGDIASRTSKAALNAATKSVSVSLQKQGTIVVCFHPGWVQTDMGGKKEADLTPNQSVSAMRQTISSLKPENSGQFLNYDGQVVPW
jgi:NAD(P)-dependent dehydrogenase (short-subunit alcohol dehydrogenase family)